MSDADKQASAQAEHKEHTDARDEQQLAPTQDAPEAQNPAGKAALGVTVLLLGLVAMYALSDRMAPSSSRGIVSAHVVQIAPRISGRVTDVMVVDDAVVRAGEPLFAIDSQPFELAVRQAEAQLSTAVQGIDASAAALVSAQAAVTRARTELDNARIEADRILVLEERGTVSRSQGDTARTRVATATAQLDSARANLERERVQLGPEGAENPAILAAQARLESAQYDLASTIVEAPHLGVVTNVTLSPGQFVAAGSPGMTFIDANAAWVSVDLRENQLQRVRPGDPARLLFDAIPGRIFEGRVQSIAWGIDPGRQVQGGLVINQVSNRWFEPARRIPVRIELAGGMDNWPENVRVGGKVHAVILTDGTRNPVALTARALQRLRSWASYLH